MNRLLDFLIDFPIACVGAVLLVFLIFIRPQEFIEPLQGLPLLNLVFGIGAIGTVIEAGLGKIRSFYTPQIPVMVLWMMWSLLPTAWRIGVGQGFSEWLVNVVFQVLFFVIVLYGAQSFGRLKGLTTAILVISLALSAVMIHQAQSDFQCVKLRQEEGGAIDFSTGTGDGRVCDTSYDCEKRNPDKSAVYDCERVGLFNSFTTGRGRIRWRGKLSDPNEVSLLVCIALTFAFALHEGSKSKLRNLGILIAIGAVGYTVVLSKSRGGILIIMTIFAVQFVRKYGMKGLIAGAALGAPLLLFGGRSGSEAEESANERMQLLYAGIDMVKQFPFLGVGVEQYKEHAWPPLTAHNSYLLPAAELGIMGQMLWYTLLYISFKIPLSVVFRTPYGMDLRLKPYAIALSTAFVGMLVGIFFLSMCYHPLVYIVLGLCGALYGAVRATAPQFKVTLDEKELAGIFASCMLFLSVMYVYTRVKGAP